jgi:hypothetical protein
LIHADILWLRRLHDSLAIFYREECSSGIKLHAADFGGGTNRAHGGSRGTGEETV